MPALSKRAGGGLLFLFGCLGLGGFIQIAQFVEELIICFPELELVQPVPCSRRDLYACLLFLFAIPIPSLPNEESHPFDKLTRL